MFAALARRPEVISFATGAPDPALLPGTLVASLARDAVARYGNSVLQYGMTRGFAPLLARAHDLLRARGVDLPDSTHIATGGSGALHNVSMALLSPGDVVLVETPTYTPAVKVFRAHGARVVEVASDESGILPDHLDAALVRHDATFVYLLPTFHNPTGRTMPVARRQQVAEVVRRRDALLVEDDVYTDLRYRGEPVPALSSFAPANSVYVTSLSKTLAPAVRIGIVAMPPDLLARVLALKQGIDMQTSTLCQAIAAEFLAGEAGRAHVAHTVASYATKLDTLVAALEAYLPAGFAWTRPDGGMFLWVTGPAGFDADAMVDRALDAGVAYLPGSAFHLDGTSHRNTMRLSFAGVAVGDIGRGVELLAKLCAEAT
jgi:2-aminoadipate transaminase